MIETEITEKTFEELAELFDLRRQVEDLRSHVEDMGPHLEIRRYKDAVFGSIRFGSFIHHVRIEGAATNEDITRAVFAGFAKKMRNELRSVTEHTFY